MKTLETIKTILIILALLLSVGAVFGKTTETDASLASDLVGKWEHMSSTYPNGDVMTYHREINLFADGTGTCIKYRETDTLTISFSWEVKACIIYLFVFSKRGKRINADAQYVSLLNSTRMHLTDAYGEDEMGKVCCYRRNGAAQF